MEEEEDVVVERRLVAEVVAGDDDGVWRFPFTPPSFFSIPTLGYISPIQFPIGLVVETV